MRTLLKLSAFMLTAMFLMGIAAAYTTQIHAPAVLLSQNRGVLTIIKLNLTSGNGTVSIKGPLSVGNSTMTSAITAVRYASKYVGVNESSYNFTYLIEDNGSNVSGPSGGLALTLLAISALKHIQLHGNFTVTGTISNTGAIGEVGGVYDKLDAAKNHHMDFALVPYAPPQSIEYLVYYLAQQTFRIPVAEVLNVSEALPYATQISNPNIIPLQLNLSSGSYKIKNLPVAPVACQNCSMGYFSQLVNFTFGMARNSTDAISGNLSAVKPGIYSELNAYQNISKKGYLYEAADLAFLQYSNIFTLANSRYYSISGANTLFNNVSAYCSSLAPPNMTSANYEYVVGGQLRQEWAIQNLAQVHSLLNASNTTDDVIFVLENLAPSYAWCRSSSEMYHIASEIGGSPVGYSEKLKSEALAAIHAANSSGLSDPMYLSAARSAYNSSQYAAALFGAAYSVSFSSKTPSNATDAQLISMINANAANSTYGIWSSQFANSALFAAYQAVHSGGNETYNITSAYFTSELAANLAGAEAKVGSGIVPINQSIANVSSTPEPIAPVLPQNSTTAAYIENQLNGIYSILLVLFVVVAILILIVLLILVKLMHIGRANTAAKSSKPARTPRKI